MKTAREVRLVVVLVVNVWLGSIANTQAQSRDSAEKHTFANLVARRTNAAAARSQRAAVTVHRSVAPTVEASPLSASPNVRPLASGGVYGTNASTNVVPPSPSTRRDTFVESLYSQILGRSANQPEVDYWAHVLSSGGMGPECVADTIWNSREHQALVRDGNAPGIPLKTAYRTAYEAAWKKK
jgi:hypothetical protein